MCNAEAKNRSFLCSFMFVNLKNPHQFIKFRVNQTAGLFSDAENCTFTGLSIQELKDPEEIVESICICNSDHLFSFEKYTSTNTLQGGFYYYSIFGTNQDIVPYLKLEISSSQCFGFHLEQGCRSGYNTLFSDHEMRRNTKLYESDLFAFGTGLGVYLKLPGSCFVAQFHGINILEKQKFYSKISECYLYVGVRQNFQRKYEISFFLSEYPASLQCLPIEKSFGQFLDNYSSND